MKEINSSNFNEIVINSNKPVVLDLWAPWCGPCRAVAPVLEELSQENTNIEFVKCNVDDNPEIAAKYNIRNIPTILFFNKGQLTDMQVGAGSKTLFKIKIDKLL